MIRITNDELEKFRLNSCTNCDSCTKCDTREVLDGLNLLSKGTLVLHVLRYMIGLKISRHFFIQSEVKLKPI